MDRTEFSDLIDSLRSEPSKEKDFDYEGYGVLDDLKLTREEIGKAVGVMWNILMAMDSKERDEKYLFPKGLVKSKELFLQQKASEKDMTEQRREVLREREVLFREKLQNVKPLVDFLIKIKEVI